MTTDEDWTKATPLPPTLNKDWLSVERSIGLLPIAHALGGADSDTYNNTFTAFEQARQQGYRVFEVDITLDEGGRLRCHHGPNAPAPFDPARSCTLDRLLPMVNQADGWLVLDIKTAFTTTASHILALAKKTGMAQRLIFQLYKPQDLTWFTQEAQNLALPTPIVTAYMSRRSVNHIASQTMRLGICALTLPIEKLPALSESLAKSTQLFTHPVHDCQDLEHAQAAGAAGIYTVVSFNPAKCAPQTR